MAHDVVITGGTVVDGTGAPAVAADIGISGDRITAVGNVEIGPNTRRIDADGAIVTPGFVDIHSHLDAQVGWDPLMTSSSLHGVTSVVMGNCGMTFAPVRPGAASTLATAMESVEDIPAACILDGLDWDWSSFGEYLNSVEARPRGLNAGAYVGDVALRFYVCGDVACDPEFRASDAQLDEMAALVDQALTEGALGYSISRSLFHRVPDGRNVPGTWSPPEEFMRIAEPLGRRQVGVIESAPRYNFPDRPGNRVAEEMAWMAELSAKLGRPFTFNLQQISSLEDHYRQVLAAATAANMEGSRLRPQITPRSVGVLFSLFANSLLDDLPSWQAVRDGGDAARLAAVNDPETRARLIAEGAHKRPEDFDAMFVMPADEPARYVFDETDSLGSWARRAGVGVVECYLDEMQRSDGRTLVNWPVMNSDEDAIADLLCDPVSIIGLADAGAHATQIMDASQPTYLLAHWVRDQGVITLEQGVAALSGDTASFIGYADRGVIAPGAFADVNVIDLDALSLEVPRIVHDFPLGAPRFVQGAQGISTTLVNGEVFMESGRPTGALAGRMLRNSLFG